jgi:hypothetical protein
VRSSYRRSFFLLRQFTKSRKFSFLCSTLCGCAAK